VSLARLYFGDYPRVSLLITLMVAGVVSWWLASLPPLYKVRATLEVVVEGDDGGRYSTLIETQIQKLLSKKLLQSALTKSKVEVAIEELEERLKASQIGQSGVIELTYCTTQPKSIKRVLATLIHLGNIDAKLTQKKSTPLTILPRSTPEESNSTEHNQTLTTQLHDQRVAW